MRQALARLGLATRIGAAITAAVVAIQILVTLVFVLHPPNLRPFYSARWLSGAVADIIRNSTSGETAPTGVSSDARNPENLAVRFENAPPGFVRGDPPWPLNRVLATVRNELGGAAPSIEAAGMGPPGEPLQVTPAGAFAKLPSGPLESGEDLLVPPTFLIAADLRNGRWLMIEPSYRAQR